MGTTCGLGGSRLRKLGIDNGPQGPIGDTINSSQYLGLATKVWRTGAATLTWFQASMRRGSWDRRRDRRFFTHKRLAFCSVCNPPRQATGRMSARNSGPRPNTDGSAKAAQSTAPIILAIGPAESERICIELQRGERVAFSVMSAGPIDMFLCTDASFFAWVGGGTGLQALAEQTDATAAHLTFRAQNTDHYSVVLVNSSETATEIGIDAPVNAK